jgi:predicted protein tyrosine phosphatase
VAAVDASTGLAHCYKLVSTPASQPVPKLINIVCSSARIALKGEVGCPTGVVLVSRVTPSLVMLSCEVTAHLELHKGSISRCKVHWRQFQTQTVHTVHFFADNMQVRQRLLLHPASGKT